MNTQTFDYDRIIRKAKELLEYHANPNKHDRVTALIFFCIEAGMSTGNQIVGSIHKMDPSFSLQHIGYMLNSFPKSPDGEPFWRKDPTAGYVLI